MQETTNRNHSGPLAGNQDTSLLKALALVFMLIDHLGVAFFGGITEFRIIGRMAFPLYAWCLVVGSVKTRNIFRYGLRLLGLGLLSQPLYMMALSHTWTDLNILFTLLIGLAALSGIRAKWYGSQLWAPALCFVLLGILKVDYSWRGVLFILILYAARETQGGLIAAYLAYGLFWGTGSAPVNQIFGIQLSFLQWTGIGTVLVSFFRMQGMIWLSLPLVAVKTHSKLKMPQWLGYALYPMHLVLLILLRLLMNGESWAALLRGF